MSELNEDVLFKALKKERGEIQLKGKSSFVSAVGFAFGRTRTPSSVW
jgi:hypothetical protein